MDEEDWREIIQLIQSELRSIGHDEIADLSNYEEREGHARYLPDPRFVVKAMLDALRRDMAARSSSTVQDSIKRLGQLVDEGKKPTEAIVWLDPVRSEVEARDHRELLVGNEAVPLALGELEELMGHLAEIGFGRDLK
ncbi:hypothetical protein [Ruegeria atlantica]|uniref:hypothetical protein n=1 Tax=Ruegeria atlantica TaxID=81569 RepID=UPI00147DA236|nr:hypothetical protein [Ruegeria atlantica]